MKFYDPLGKTTKYHNNLTHWEQDNATYFITFRLADSIPTEAIRKLGIKRDSWLLANPPPWPLETELEFHHLFSQKLDEWMDRGHGECLLQRVELRAALTDNLLQGHEKTYEMRSFVIMPNHVHILASLKDISLPDALKRWKGSSATVINRMAGRTGTLWQKDYFDRLIRGSEHLFNAARYIQRNPVKAKLREHEFTYWTKE